MPDTSEMADLCGVRAKREALRTKTRGTYLTYRGEPMLASDRSGGRVLDARGGTMREGRA